MRGCSPANITKLIKAGRIDDALIKQGAREKIDSDLADSILAKTLDTAKMRGKPAVVGPLIDTTDHSTKQSHKNTIQGESLDDIRKKQARVKLEEQKLNLAERKSQTVEKNRVIEACSAAGTAIREHLMSRNRRLAEQASTMNDAREIKAMLDADDRAMLQMISHDFMRRVSTDGEDAPTEH